MSFVSSVPGLAPLFAVLVAACADPGRPPPPAVDGVWEGEVMRRGEPQVFQVELETRGVFEQDGFFGPTMVALLEGRATVQVGDSIVEYGVVGQQGTLGVDLDLDGSDGSHYTFSAFYSYSGGDVLDGHVFYYRPPDGLFHGQFALMLRRVSGT